MRASGVLLPLFSLPSPYGVGSLGQGAYDFVDFLAGPPALLANAAHRPHQLGTPLPKLFHLCGEPLLHRLGPVGGPGTFDSRRAGKRPPAPRRSGTWTMPGCLRPLWVLRRAFGRFAEAPGHPVPGFYGAKRPLAAGLRPVHGPEGGKRVRVLAPVAPGSKSRQQEALEAARLRLGRTSPSIASCNMPSQSSSRP